MTRKLDKTAPARRPRRGGSRSRGGTEDIAPSPAEERGRQRLQKYLAAAGIGSRRQCEEYITAGRVTVDGEIVTKLGSTVDPAAEAVCFDGEPVRTEKHVYRWLNKPPGVLSTTRDTHGRPTVLDLIPPLAQRVYCVGRLDEQSTGLMLLTNDGALAQRLTHPRFGVAKMYDIMVAGAVGQATLANLRKGVWLAEGKVRPSQIRRLGSKGKATRLRIVLREGRNREIRRMFARFGHKVMKLERIGIGPVRMRRLKPGQSRPATAEEIRMLKEAAAHSRRPSPSTEASPEGRKTRSPRSSSGRAPRAGKRND